MSVEKLIWNLESCLKHPFQPFRLSLLTEKKHMNGNLIGLSLCSPKAHAF